MLKTYKYALSRFGAHLSAETIRKANAVVNYLEFGRWLRAYGYSPSVRFRNREALWDHIASAVGAAKVLYLEFGVWKGASLQYWSKLLTNPESQLYGFDSFEGLPEYWQLDCPKGAFSTNGQMPAFSDPRVHLVKGLFQETLPHYKLPPHDVLVVNLDADLYSSTIYVLNTLRDAIVQGTYLIFDEFSDRLNELRAFDEFLQSGKALFSLVGTTRSMTSVAFRRH